MSRFSFRSFPAAISCLAALLWPGISLAQTAYAVTSTNQLARFSLSAPETISASLPITGLAGGESVLGIDFRPASGALFALGSTSRLYTIDPTTGAATQVGSSGTFTLSGTSFGFDFNPLVDRIRVVSDTGQNLRLTPDGTLAATDGSLAYGIGESPGSAPAVGAAAYTRDLGGVTNLYAIGAARDALVTMNPPDAGTLNTVGPLGVDASVVGGFDMVTLNSIDYAYAALQVGGTSGLYRINLSTGAAGLVGNFPAGMTVTGFAIQAVSQSLVNLATRAPVQSGDNVMIGGFIIQGSAPQTVLVRARGPSLVQFGVPAVLANPQVQLYAGQTPIAYNDDWGDASNATAIQETGFAPENANESAILVTLAPGGYTAIVSGVGGVTGIAIVEVFVVP